MTRFTTGLGPNPIVGGAGGMRGGSGGAPIAFTASAPGLVNGQSIMLDTGTLQSGFRTPYFIDEIRIQVVTDEFKVEGGGFAWPGIGGNIRVKFQTGNRQFSKFGVPIGLYGPVFSNRDFGTVDSGVDGDGDAVRRSYSNVRWPLPKPLWMAPGDVIQAVFTYDAIMGVAEVVPKPPVTVNVTYIGRSIAPGTPAPSTRQIPWVSFFEYKTDDGYLSTTDEFRNPFTYPMIVQRFTERTFFEEGDPSQNLREELSRGQTPAMLNTNGQFVSMRLYDSLGYAIVKEFAPIGLVMDTSRHAWTFSRSLGAREQFDLTLRTDDPAGAASTPIPGWHTFTGMVGYRDEVRD
jgi:hypothetical protein